MKTVCIPANSTATTFVETSRVHRRVLLEPFDSLDPSLQNVGSLVEFRKDSSIVVEITNTGKLTLQLESGTTKLGQVVEFELISKSQDTPTAIKELSGVSKYRCC